MAYYLLRSAARKAIATGTSAYWGDIVFRSASAAAFSFHHGKDFRLPLTRCNISSLSAAAELRHSRSPCLMISLKDTAADNGQLKHSLYRLSDKQVIGLKPNNKVPNDAWWCGSSHGWLAYVCTEDGSYFLMNPYSEDTVRIPLPCIRTLCRPPPTTHLEHKYFVTGAVLKVALSSPPTTTTSPESCCVVVALQQDGRISFCRPGDVSWTPLKDRFYHDDICYSNKQQLLYGVSCEGLIKVWDFKDPSSPQQTSLNYMDASDAHHDDRFLESFDRNSKKEKKLRDKCEKENYLIESVSGDILLVKRFIAQNIDEDGTIYRLKEVMKLGQDPNLKLISYKTVRFDVYKLDLRKNMFKFMDSLDEEALFLGPNNAFSVSTVSCPRLKSNSIYFTDYRRYNYDFEPWGGHDMGIYDLKHCSITPPYPCPFRKIMPPPFWVAPC